MKKSIITKASFCCKIKITISLYNFLIKKRNLNHSNKDKKNRSKKVNTWWVNKRYTTLENYKEIV